MKGHVIETWDDEALARSKSFQEYFNDLSSN